MIERRYRLMAILIDRGAGLGDAAERRECMFGPEELEIELKRVIGGDLVLEIEGFKLVEVGG